MGRRATRHDERVQGGGLRRRDVVVLFIVVVALAVGGGLALTGGPEEPRRQGLADLEELAGELGCDRVEPLDPMDAPIRGGASTGGIECLVGPDEVHIFVRAPIGDGDDSDTSYADAQGGSLENIDRLVGTGDPRPCLSLLVGRDWFILANDEELLRSAEDSIGGVERPILRATPPASYVGPGGCQAQEPSTS